MSSAAYSLYIVRCADGSLYTGIAMDVARRLAEHESGPRGAKYLRGRGPLALAYQQVIGGRSTASKVEHRVKSLPRAEKESLIAGRISLAEIEAMQLVCQASGAGGG